VRNAGLEVDQIVSDFSFFLGIRMSFYMEVVAKLRAARRLWAKFLKENINLSISNL